MPFELGLAIGRTQRRRPRHEWFVFEARRFRLQRSLSDLNGTDPYIHRAQPRQVLVELTNALVRADRQPTIEELTEINRVLRRGPREFARPMPACMEPVHSEISSSWRRILWSTS